MKTRSKIIFALLLCAALGIGGALSLRLRNGVRVRAPEANIPPEHVVFYRQDDPAWASDRLGNSKYKMKRSGCLVTCIASAISAEGDAVAPDTLNALFSENSVYDDQGNMQWSALAAIDGYHAEVYDEASAAAIDECLAGGHHPIVRVRMGGIGNTHYVLIAGAEAGEYICMDPLEDRPTTLSRYWDRIYAVRCVWRET